MASITTFFGTQGGGGGGISGSGAAGQVAFFNGASSIDSDPLLLYDDTADTFTVGSTTNGTARLNVQGFGAGASAPDRGIAIADLNGTEVFSVGDSGKMYLNATKADESLSNNVIIGDGFTGLSVTTLSNSVITGAGAARYVTGGSDSVILGREAYQRRGGGTQQVNNPTDCIAIGREARSGASSGTVTNEIVIGAGAIGGGSNTVTIGNSLTTYATIGGNSTLEATNISAINQLSANIVRVNQGGIEPSNTNGFKIGNQVTDKIAFWAKTPIAQPSTSVGSATVASPGAGNTIKTDDTFDGYTLAQVVKALRNIGVLA